MNNQSLIKGIHSQKGSVQSQSDNSIRVKWDASASFAVGEFQKARDGRWSYRSLTSN